MFTSQHYVAIATMLRKYGEFIPKQKLIEDLVTFFKEDNPKFNPTLFTSACYCESNTE